MPELGATNCSYSRRCDFLWHAVATVRSVFNDSLQLCKLLS